MPTQLPSLSSVPRSEVYQIDSFDPATGEKIGHVQTTPDAALGFVLQQSRAAQEQWARWSVQERAAVLRQVADLTVDRIDALADLISRESGKPRAEAISTEIFPNIYLIDYFCRNAAAFLREEPIDLRLWRYLGRRSTLQRTPRGVVAVVSPWNFPFSIPGGEIAMALIAGNAVIFKPARATCLIGEALAALYHDAGLPPNLLQLVHGSGRAVVQLPVDLISFTGSVAVGKEIMASAATHLTPVMLELGGKDPLIVCDDANLEVAAATAVWGGFVNSGQACASVERVYVDARVAEDFIARVVAKTECLRQGPGMDPNVDVGAMCTREQFDAVVEQVRAARQSGARICTGGESNDALAPGLFYKPTVLTDVQQSWPCMQEETFGPTLPILTFHSDDEAVALANDSPFGLTASVFTRNVRRGKALASRLQAGTVTVNEALFTHGLAETPWGGGKATGIGRTHGKLGLLEYTEPRHVHVNRWHGVKNPWLFPYSPASTQMFKATAGLLRSGMRSRFMGAKGALRHLPEVLRSRL